MEDKLRPGLFKDYELVGKIGEGTYGVVYKAKKGKEVDRKPWFDIISPPYYAVKIPKKNKKIELPTISSLSNIREIKFLRELRHPNIINLNEIIIDSKNQEFALVFEYAEYELMKIINYYKEEVKKPLPEFTLKSFLFQLLRGYLHENWIMHRDLKPENIFVIGGNGPRRGTLVLGDLGMARIFRSPVLPMGMVDREVVTLWYRCPELLLGAQQYTPAIDIWSIGCIFAAMLLVREKSVMALFQGEEIKPEGEKSAPPFQSFQCNSIFQVMGFPGYNGVEKLPEYVRIVNWPKEKSYPRENVLKTRFPPDTSADALDLLAKMCELNPAYRITANDALKHKYFTQKLPHPDPVNAIDVKLPDNKIQQLDFPIQPPQPMEPEHIKATEQDIAARRKAVEARYTAQGRNTVSPVDTKRIRYGDL